MSYVPTIPRLPRGCTLARAERLCAEHGFGVVRYRPGWGDNPLGTWGGYVLHRGGVPVAYADGLRDLPWRMERALDPTSTVRERWGTRPPMPPDYRVLDGELVRDLPTGPRSYVTVTVTA